MILIRKNTLNIIVSGVIQHYYEKKLIGVEAPIGLQMKNKDLFLYNITCICAQ